MSFHLGKPLLILLILAAASGLGVLTRRPAPKADLTVWVYTDDDAQAYREGSPGGVPSLIEQYRRRIGLSVDVELVSERALDARLMSLFMSPLSSRRAPDLVEIDIGSVGKYFRPPVQQIGLLPLNDFLAQSGELGEILPSRLTTWSKDGAIFGVPLDVHPTTITYRKDLFDEAGIDLEAARTWPEFQQKCLDFQGYWLVHGYPSRRAIELFPNHSEELLLMLLQRHINIVDEHNRIHFRDPKVAKTVAFYAQLVAGHKQIAGDTLASSAFGYRDLADGNVCAMLTPDWRAGYIKEYAPELAGKLRMRPLPVFDEDDAPTSTWGGTMMGIPRQARDPQAAWKLLEFLCFSPEAAAARRRSSAIVSAMPRTWTEPIRASGDPFFGGQEIDQLYFSLAPQVPPRCITPFSITAQAGLTMVLSHAVAHVQAHGTEGLEEACSAWLEEAASELEQWVHYGDFGR
jgi:arabinosaccharide transport system substrate-binding protein